MRRLFLATTLLVLTTGCYRTAIRTGAPEHGRTVERTGFNFVYGLTSIEHGAVECPHGIARVETSVPWYNYLLAPITAGLISAMDAKYVCATSGVVEAER